VFNKPLSTENFDPERLQGLLAHGIESHPEPQEVNRFLRAGAEFTLRRIDDETARVVLVMTPSATGLAAMRAEAAGVPVNAADAPPAAAELFIIDCPTSDLQRVNIG
jgi:hypothetical protein